MISHGVLKFGALFMHTQVLWFTLAFISLYYLLKFLRLFYYLYEIPGPKGYPLIGNSLIFRGTPQEFSASFFKLFEKCGSFFNIWLGPIPVTFTSDPNIVQIMLTHPHSLDKAWLMRDVAFPFVRDSILIARVEKWKRNRKIMNHGFGPQILNSFLPIFQSIGDILLEQLKKEVDNPKPFDAFEYFGRATLDSICASAMGTKINSQTTNCPYFDAINCELKVLFKRGFNIWLYPDFIFNRTLLAKKQEQSLKVMWDMTNTVINEKLKEVNKNPDRMEKYQNVDQPIEKNPLKKPFLDFLLDLVEINPEFSLEQLKEEVNVMIIAAYETTAMSLSHTMLALGARKDIQDRAYKELYNIFGESDRPIELSDLTNMRYLEMVIKESLRLFPAVANIMRDVSKDMKIGKYTIPAGTNLFISIVQTHRNPEHWKNPMEFIPERFLPEEVQNRHPFAFIPFSGGPRNCIGMRYAMMFLKYQVANILRKYEVHTDLKLNELEFIVELSMKLVGGDLIRITERKIHKE